MIVWIILLVGLLAVLLVVASDALQYRFLFNATQLPPDYQFTFSEPFEEVFIQSGKASINGLYFKSSAKKGLVIYFHGNADNLAQWGGLSKDFTEKGFDLLIVDYPTFGKSTGRLGQKQLISMGFDVYDYCKKYYPENKLVLFGRSMGTGILSKVATERMPGLLILESPYVNIKMLVDHHVPKYLPASFFISFNPDNKKNIPLIKCPVLIFHGTRDDIVPYEHALELSGVFKKTDRLVTFEGGDHRNLREYKLFHEELKKAFDVLE